MLLRTIAALAPLCCLPLGLALGQEEVLIPVLNPGFVKLGVDSLAVYLVRGSDTVPVGHVRDELTIHKVDGAAHFVRVYTSINRLFGNGVDTIVDRTEGLFPVSHHSHGDEEATTLDFTRGRVRGWRWSAFGDSSRINTELPAVAYNGASFDLILRASELEPGLRIAIPSFLWRSRTVDTLTAQARGLETLRGVDCWVVDANFSGMSVTFWIEDGGRRLRQQVMDVQPGVQMIYTWPRG
jgi:hypothetical protein